MRVFVDTNVIVDVVARREPFFTDSQAVLSLCALKEIDGIVSDLTFCNVAYVMRKQLNSAQLRSSLSVLKQFLEIAPIGDAGISFALANDTSDFEDAVQLAAAQAARAEVIVTRNVRHFSNSLIRVSTPSDFLMQM